MSRQRFVVFGVARARSAWFARVAQWATSGAAPIEFVKCVSAEELRAHLARGRRVSAALLDESLPAVDRDLIATARDAGCAALVVRTLGAGRRRDWTTLGAAAVMSPDFERDELVDALNACCAMVNDGPPHRDDVVPLPAQLGRVIAVTGPGGTGASTAAMALAQQLAFECVPESVVLADLALRAHQAMLNDVRDVVPGIQELVDAHRGRHPAPAEVRSMTFFVEPRGYALLLGLRRPRYWSSIQTRAFDAALTSLRHAYSTVVCDITGDVEGEEQGGSVDVEDRNVMARTAVLTADAVVAVGLPGLKGIHALVNLVRDILDVGVPSSRVVTAVNQAPRAPRARAEITSTIAHLLAGTAGAEKLATPVFLPATRVEAALMDLAPLPSRLGAVLAGAIDATTGRKSPRVAQPAVPRRIEPGELGTWTEQTG